MSTLSLRSLARGLGLIRSPIGKPVRRRPGARSGPGLEVLEDRIAMNNRFVVPFEQTADDTTTFHTLARALSKAGLVSGDTVQIEPNSTPGPLSDSNLPAITNLTIRGHQGFAARDLPQIVTQDALSVDQVGTKFENLNLLLSGGGLTFNVNGSLLSSFVVYGGLTNADVVRLNGTTAAVVQNNTLINETLGFGASNDVIQVTTAAGAQNVIAANTIQTFNAVPLLHYLGNNTIADRVEDNVFLGNELAGGAESSTNMVVVEQLSGLTIQRNVFHDGTAVLFPISVEFGVQNLKVLNNVFEFPGASIGDAIVHVGSNGVAGLTTSVTIAYNQFRTPATDIFIRSASSGTVNVKVEGNDFIGNSRAVFITSNGGTLANVDLGGGNQGSLGGNNFRIYTAAATATTGAIVVNTPSSTLGTIQAQNNLFGTANPETAVFDNGDDATRADVVTTGAPSGISAFVQALFVKFLKRTGDLANPGDAGGWVNALVSGASANSVANGIVRSPEALGFVVDGLYRSILGRDADAAGRALHVSLLGSGSTIEQIQSAFLASAEYRLRFAGDSAYVVSLYQSLLGRTPNPGETDGWTTLLPSLGRQGVAAAFLGSIEFRNREVSKLYVELLKRSAAPSAGEVASAVNSGLDLLSLRVSFAGSAEFQVNG